MSYADVLLKALQKSWIESGLARVPYEASEPRIEPLFIEQIGKASAENTRSAALVSWFNSNPTGKDQTAVLKLLLPDFSRRPIPYFAVRELKLSKSCRVDIAFFDGAGALAACVEVKWLAEANVEQLARYREALDEKCPSKKVELISLAPIALAPEVGQKAPDWRAIRWENLAECMCSSGSIDSSADYELGRSLVRVRSLSKAAESLISANATVAEAQSVFKWLHKPAIDRDSFKDFEVPTDDSHAELFKRMLTTELAEATVRELNSRYPHASWRRVRTVNGPHQDTQSDLVPGAVCDGKVAISVAGMCPVIFVRFHVDASFRRITTQVGTQVYPYLDGKKRKNWIAQNGEVYQRLLEIIAKTREDVLRACEEAKLTVNGGRPDVAQWYKSFSYQEHMDQDRFAALINRACDLSRCVFDYLSKES